MQGDSDVGDIVMLVALWWWPVWDVGGRVIVLVTFFRYVGDFLNVLNRYLVSDLRHQHRCNLDAMINDESVILAAEKEDVSALYMNFLLDLN